MNVTPDKLEYIYKTIRALAQTNGLPKPNRSIVKSLIMQSWEHIHTLDVATQATIVGCEYIDMMEGLGGKDDIAIAEALD